MKKQSFSLIEMIIALGLLGLLMTTLFFWYQHIALRWIQSPVYFQEQTQEYYAFHQLETVFSHLDAPPLSTHPYFYTETSSDGSTDLFFTFDQGVDRDPAFSGILLAKLHLVNHHLVLTVWPHPQFRDQIAPRTRTLLSGIHRCSFLGLAPHHSTTLPIPSNAIGIPPIHPGWHVLWHLEWQQVPGLIQITLSGEREYCWIFDSNLPILYGEEQIVPSSWEGIS